MKTTGSGDKILDWGVIIAAAMLFFKTSDLMAYFSPTNLNDFFGWDVSLYYGATCAILVEGLALALHFNSRARMSNTAQAVKWILLVISGVAQIFDGFVVTKTLQQLSPDMRGLLSYGVPLIPLLIMVMVFGIGHLPETSNNSSTMPQNAKKSGQGAKNNGGRQNGSSEQKFYDLGEFLKEIGLDKNAAKALVKGSADHNEAFRKLVLDRGKGDDTDISGKNFRTLYYRELNPTNGQRK